MKPNLVSSLSRRASSSQRCLISWPHGSPHNDLGPGCIVIQWYSYTCCPSMTLGFPKRTWCFKNGNGSVDKRWPMIFDSRNKAQKCFERSNTKFQSVWKTCYKSTLIFWYSKPSHNGIASIVPTCPTPCWVKVLRRHVRRIAKSAYSWPESSTASKKKLQCLFPQESVTWTKHELFTLKGCRGLQDAHSNPRESWWVGHRISYLSIQTKNAQKSR